MSKKKPLEPQLHDDCAEGEHGELVECPRCRGPLVFDPDAVGETCGGLTLIGWMRCDACVRANRKAYWHAGFLGRSHEKWRVSGSGRSVEIGTGRVRIEGHPDPDKVAARIARLPELELEVARLRTRLRASTTETIPAPEGEER